jgi:hypothetical protein
MSNPPDSGVLLRGVGNRGIREQLGVVTLICCDTFSKRSICDE